MNEELKNELGFLCAQFAAETREMVNQDQHTIGGFWMWKEAELLSHIETLRAIRRRRTFDDWLNNGSNNKRHDR
jgi:hypothetical protein